MDAFPTLRLVPFFCVDMISLHGPGLLVRGRDEDENDDIRDQSRLIHYRKIIPQKRMLRRCLSSRLEY